MSKTTIPEFTYLSEAIEYINENVTGKGVRCPACEKRCKIDKRGFTSKMLRSLMLLREYDEQNPGEWCHTNYLEERGANRSGDVSSIRHWEMIEKKPGNKEGMNPRRGLWRITQKGYDFLDGKIRIPKAWLGFKGQCYGLDESKLISVNIAWGVKFDYKEVVIDPALPSKEDKKRYKEHLKQKRKERERKEREMTKLRQSQTL